MPSGDNLRQPDPTPDELRQRCLAIQKKWSKETEVARRAVKPTAVKVPTYPRAIIESD